MDSRRLEENLFDALTARDVEKTKKAVDNIILKRQEIAEQQPELKKYFIAPTLEATMPAGCHSHQTPLIYAIHQNLSECVEVLIAAKADVNHLNPLITAVCMNDIKSADLLLKANANPNIRTVAIGYWSSPLMLAAEGNSESMIKLLLEAKANVNTRRYSLFGDTALSVAFAKGNVSCVNVLLKAQNKSNDSSQLPLEEQKSLFSPRS